MIKTLSQAKKDFTVGKTILVVENIHKPDRVGAKGLITKVFTNKFEYLDSLTDRVFTFWWGTTKENIYEDDILTIVNKHTNNIDFKYQLMGDK